MKNTTGYKSTLVAVTLVSLTLVSQAIAADISDASQSAYTESFKALDIDGSNSLTRTEAKKENQLAKNFAAADTNKDGTLDEQEYTNYKSKTEKEGVKRVVKDSVITSKVKGSLLKDEGLKSLKVSVKTNHGIVFLSGLVETEAQILQAGKIAAETEGALSVKNSLLLKKE